MGSGAVTAGTKAGSAAACLARLASPREQLLRRQPVPTGHHRHRRARNERLLQDPRPVVGTPAPAAERAVDHLETPDRPLRLKYTVKSRHKTILSCGSSNCPVRSPHRRWGRNIAYVPSRCLSDQTGCTPHTPVETAKLKSLDPEGDLRDVFTRRAGHSRKDLLSAFSGTGRQFRPVFAPPDWLGRLSNAEGTVLNHKPRQVRGLNDPTQHERRSIFPKPSI